MQIDSESQMFFRHYIFFKKSWINKDEYKSPVAIGKRPQGMVGRDNFNYVEQPIPEPQDGQVLVRNLYLSFDPTQRGWMEDRESYLPPVALGEPMRAGSIGQVTESRHADFAVGDIVQTTGGWQDFVVAARRPGANGIVQSP